MEGCPLRQREDATSGCGIGHTIKDALHCQPVDSSKDEYCFILPLNGNVAVGFVIPPDGAG